MTTSRSTALDHHPSPQKICLNPASAKSLIGHYTNLGSTCKVSRLTEPDGAVVTESTCDYPKTQESSHLRSEWSPDGRTLHDRIDSTNNDPASVLPKQTWQESTLQYLGDCPVPMRPDQGMLFIDADGKARDLTEQLHQIEKGIASPSGQSDGGADSH